MRALGLGLVVITVALSTAACKKKTADSGGGSGSAGSAMTDGSGSAGSGSAATDGSGSGSAMTGSGSGSDAGSGSSAAAGSGSGSGSGSDAGDQSMAHKAGMCPSTVAGSATKVEVKDGKVMVMVTSADKDAIKAIQQRTEELLKEKADNMGDKGKTGSEHDMKGTHGGGQGLCPVHVPPDATATAKKDAKGVTVTIVLKDPKGADAVKTDIEGRITKAGEWMKANLKEGDKGTTGGVGGGSGKHGMNHSGDGDGKGQEKKAGSGSAK